MLDTSFAYCQTDSLGLVRAAEAGLRYLLSKPGLQVFKSTFTRPDTVVLIRLGRPGEGEYQLDLPVRWVGKESLFHGLTGATLGRLMRLWGGRPVDRHRATGAVEQLAELMQAEPWIWLGLSPEGTRKHTDRVCSGFYYVALKLDLPVALAYIDYATREVGVSHFVHMSGSTPVTCVWRAYKPELHRPIPGPPVR